MRPWNKLTNDELALNLDLWLNVDRRISSKSQEDFFREVIWRLRVKEDNDCKS